MNGISLTEFLRPFGNKQTKLERENSAKQKNIKPMHFITMNKYIYAILVLLCFGCQHPEKQRVDNNMPLTTKNNKRSFKDFLIKFSSDSVYQINHVSFPIELRCNGYDFEGEDTTYIIDNKDWDNINLFDSIIDGQKVSTIIDESKNMATMRGEECGILVHYMFKKSNGTWILHKIIDSTN